jgi:hypothetical protein
MLGSMGTKGGTILYHIGYGGYGTTLGCLAISGVTSCYQPKCWLTNVGWVTKPNYELWHMYTNLYHWFARHGSGREHYENLHPQRLN